MRRAVWLLALIGFTVALAPRLPAAGYTIATIDYPAGGNTQTSAYGINNLGQIVGSYTVPGTLTTHGFHYDNGTFTAIDVPNNPNTEPRAISDLGTIVGQTSSYSSGVSAGFVDNGGISRIVRAGLSSNTLLSGINDSGLIVGWYLDSASAQHGMIGSTSSPLLFNFDYPSSVGSELSGVNNLGAVTGSAPTSCPSC